MTITERDVLSRGGGDAIDTIELLRMPMDTPEQRGEAFGKTIMIAGNLGTHNVQDILELWLADDHWRDFAYQPVRGSALRVQLLPGEFDYFLSVIDWSPKFIDDNVGDQALKAEAFAHIDPDTSEERRRPIEQVRVQVGPPLSDSMEARSLPKELRQVIRHETKRDAYRAGRSQTSIARAGRQQVKVDVWENSDTAALADKLLADLEARGGDVYTELIGKLIEREGWKGLVVRRDEHIRRLDRTEIQPGKTMSQRQIAERIGVDSATVSRALQNATPNGHKPNA